MYICENLDGFGLLSSVYHTPLWCYIDLHVRYSIMIPEVISMFARNHNILSLTSQSLSAFCVRQLLVIICVYTWLMNKPLYTEVLTSVPYPHWR